ncbi:MAG: hypothetical protein RDU20_17730 [Desulfomonilaceae bacterium]|nr:hypothetical protein [Desulfomonilaceae bacterium]
MKPPIRRVKASVLVKDLEARLSDLQVMRKHGLTAEQLEYLLHKMEHSGLITRRLLEARANLAETAVTKAFVEMRQSMDELDRIDYTERSCADQAAAGSSAWHDLTSEGSHGHPGDGGHVYADMLRAFSEAEVTSPKPSAQPRGRRIIRASDLVKDITSGMTDPMLMEKHQLEPKQLEFMLRKLVAAGRVTETQLVERTSITSTSITKAFVDVYQSLRELDEDG